MRGIIRALNDPPAGLEELRAVLLRVTDGLSGGSPGTIVATESWAPTGSTLWDNDPGGKGMGELKFEKPWGLAYRKMTASQLIPIASIKGFEPVPIP